MMHERSAERIATIAETVGWHAALAEAQRESIVSSGRLFEDPRAADWQYLLPTTERRAALVVSIADVGVPFALATRWERVLVVDASVGRARYVSARSAQTSSRVQAVTAEASALPVQSTSFDLVALSASHTPSARPIELAREIRRTLRPKGVAYILLRAGWSIGRVFRRSPGSRVEPLRSWTDALRAVGFGPVEAYVPLPDGRAPLFHVPLDGWVMRYFARSTLPLVRTAPPSVRRRHGLLLRSMPLIGLALRLPLIGSLAPHFVPEVALIVRAI